METYSKEGNGLKITKQIEDCICYSYETILNTIAHHESEVIRWKALKLKAEELEINKPVEESPIEQ